MKQPEEVKLEFTREWVRRAEGDFQTAQHLCASGEEHVYATAFHAQQAAEKYLKAFLVWHQTEFPKTHDIGTLLNLAAVSDPDIPEALADATDLTPYGVEYRYPGDYPNVTVNDAENAVDLAGRVRAQIRRRLPKGTLP